MPGDCVTIENMSIIKRVCSGCGKEERTGSRALMCTSCYYEIKRNKHIKSERQRILDCYGNVEGPAHNSHGLGFDVSPELDDAALDAAWEEVKKLGLDKNVTTDGLTNHLTVNG